MAHPRIIQAALGLILAFSPMTASADSLRYQAIWHSGTGTNIFTGPLPLQNFLEKGSELTEQGLRLIDVESKIENGKRVYTGVWLSGSGGNIFSGPMGPVQFREARLARENQGLRLVDVEIFRTANGSRRYLGVWRPGEGRELVTPPLREAEFLARGELLTRDGLRLVDVEVEIVSGQLVYTGLWREGRGSNIFTTPRLLPAFVQVREEMARKGLELVDFERVPGGSAPRFIGVFSPGNGEGILTSPRRLQEFIQVGASQTNQGRRTEDVEVFRVAQRVPGIEPEEEPASEATAADLPRLPNWITFSTNVQLVIDWGIMVETPEGRRHPRMTIPTDALPKWLPLNDMGEWVLPDAFCGMNIRGVSSISWQVGEEVLGDSIEESQSPFNHIPELSAIENSSDFLLGGIEFTGPIGGCEGSNKGWDFPYPIMKASNFDTALASLARSDAGNLKLILELDPGAEIRFLDKQGSSAKLLTIDKLYKDKTFEKMEKMADYFIKTLKTDGGYCKIDQYLAELCAERGSNNPRCLVGTDFNQASPCLD